MLRLGAATAVTSFGAALFGMPKPARAQPLTGRVPEVDRVAIRVVTDSYHHAFEQGREVGDMEIVRYAFDLAQGSRRARRCRTSGASPCICNPGGHRF